jgi:hypothetical protein
VDRRTRFDARLTATDHGCVTTRAGKLLLKLAEKKFDGVMPEIRGDILGFHDRMKFPDQHGISLQLNALRAYRPVAQNLSSASPATASATISGFLSAASPSAAAAAGRNFICRNAARTQQR